MNSNILNLTWRRMALAVVFAAGPALIALSGTHLRAEDVASGQEKGGVCRADVQKFCGDIERGEGRIRQCLQENRASLSASCQERLAKREERQAAFKAACGADAKSLCGEKRGRELRQCMKANRKNVSADCKAFIKAAREKRKEKKGTE